MADPPPVRGIHHLANVCSDMETTREFYEDTLGFRTVKKTMNYDDPDKRHYFFSATADGRPGTVVSYLEYPEWDGTPGPGTSHHVAFSVRDRRALTDWRDRLVEHGISVSEVKDRTYFTSIYFADPDGLVLEFATDGPGFGIDESVPGREIIEPPDDVL